MEEAGDSTAKLSIYRAARTIKRRDNSLYNALRSIYEDSIFVGEISQLWSDLPLLANLRCGLWYSSKFQSTCYFKSTDGHTNNWSFNTSRLNLHVAQLALQKGGCIIVDSTRKGKRFPDSISKTIPIWTCVLNRCIARYRSRMPNNGSTADELANYGLSQDNKASVATDWDCSLHLPLWVSETERAAIEDRLETWTDELEAVGADIASIVSLKKPLRPLWISQRTVIWLNEVPEHDSWNFTPIILLSASCSIGPIQHTTTSEFSWSYIAGAGDDEESWARSLSPNLFWSNVYDLINSGPDLCNQKVADIVERDRVYRAQRGHAAPQVRVKGPKINASIDDFSHAELLLSSLPGVEENLRSNNEDCPTTWLASTSIAIGSTLLLNFFCAAERTCNVDCILNCAPESISKCVPNVELELHLPMMNSKFDRFSLLSNLPAAVNFAKNNLSKGKTLLICCQNGEDISICVCLAILISLFSDEGIYDDGKSYSEKSITKLEMRRRLVFICKYAINARPSRGNLKQVFAFLNGGRATASSLGED